MIFASIFSAKIIYNPHSIQENNIEQYRIGLAKINEKYFDEYNNRIIVKSKYKIEDGNCLLKASGLNGLNVMQYRNEDEANEALEHFLSLNYVEYAQIDRQISIDETANGSTKIDLSKNTHLSWGSDLLGIDEYQNYLLEKFGSNNLPTVYVAVIDSGIDTDNEFLSGRISYEFGISYCNSKTESKYAFEDDNSHGTHVSGTIVDLTLGNVKIIPVKVLNSEGSGSVSNIISGMEYILSLKDKGLNVVAANMSLGGYDYAGSMKNPVTKLYDNNIMPVVAAGNDNYYVEDYEPANIEKALTISALAQNEINANFPIIANYSNFGSGVDLCLPGSGIVSCVPDNTRYENPYTSTTGGKYSSLNGTSMATPHASALVALLASYYGSGYNVTNVERQLKSNTYDFGRLGHDEIFGYGVPCIALAIDEDTSTFSPIVNYGEIGGEYHFENTLVVNITENNSDKNYIHKIYYTLDGSYPTLISHLEYENGITISSSTLLKFVIYSFDEFGNIKGNSQVFEVTYFKGNESKNTDGTGFEINSNGVVTGYSGSIRDIVMPKYINGIEVKKLSSNLFYGLNVRSFVCLQDIALESYPFVSCSELETITLYSTTCKKIANACYALKELILPNTKTIEAGFFVSVLLGFIDGSYTFKKCHNLQRIYAPNVTRVEEYTYAGQKRLSDLEIDWKNINFIGKDAFKDCISLTYDIVLPGKFTTIPSNAFSGSGIKSITATNVTEIQNSAFSNCKSLSFASFGNISSIGEKAFLFCDNLESINNLDSDVVIGKKAFSYCTSLSEIQIPENATLEDYAFESCTALTRVDLPNCAFGSYVFNQCSNLTTVIISKEMTVIPDGMFRFCGKLNEIDIKNIKSIGSEAFSFCSILKSIDLTNCEELSAVDGVGKNFYGCSALEQVTLGKMVTIIPSYSFDYCSRLKEIDLSNVEVIGKRSFNYCSSLTEVKLSRLKSIVSDSFPSSNSNLKLILGDNEYLISSDQNLDFPNVESVYLSKGYTGKIGKFIKNNYAYSYEIDDYIIRTKEQKYSVVFKLDDGTVVSTKLVDGKTKISVPYSYEYNGANYHFYSWKDVYTGAIVLTSNIRYTSKDVTYVASNFTKKDIEFNVNFYYGYDFDGSGNINDDGDLFKKVSVIKGQKASGIAVPTKPSDGRYEYVFVGWQYNGEIYALEDLPNITQEISVYAKFEEVVRKFKVSWYGFDGALVYSEYVEYGTAPKFNKDKALFALDYKNLPVTNKIVLFLAVIDCWRPKINAVYSDCNFYASCE